jgi:hypothetical protein
MLKPFIKSVGHVIGCPVALLSLSKATIRYDQMPVDGRADAILIPRESTGNTTTVTLVVNIPALHMRRPATNMW